MSEIDGDLRKPLDVWNEIYLLSQLPSDASDDLRIMFKLDFL